MADMPRKMTEEQLAVFHDGERRGFDVADARNYFENMNPQAPRVCQVIRTPYVYADRPVVALTSTSKKDANRDADGFLVTGMVDLFVLAENDRTALTVDGFEECVKTRKLRSLSEVDPDGTDALGTAGGKKVTQRDAYGDVQRFASVGAEYPHMKICDEYIEDGLLLAKLLGDKLPDERSYWKEYVPSVISNLEAAERGRMSPKTGEPFRMVGRVRTVRAAKAWLEEKGDPDPGRDPRTMDAPEY